VPLRVDADRLRADFDDLAAIGATADGGVDRETFSAAHLAARAWFHERAGAAGLGTRVDGAANHSAVLPANDPNARTLLLGSHLDSVRRGGRFDGALGVVCALEVLRSVQDAELALPVTLEAVDFTDEEGTLIGTFGSLALVGGLTHESLAAARCGREVLVAELARMKLAEEGILTARRDSATLAGYLELHIEQGPVLEQAGIDIGIVTGIVGTASFNLVFEGESRHAGTTPMRVRRDAAVGAAAFVVGVRALVTHAFPGAVATVGDIRVEPGSFNVVPGRATLRLECRSLDAPELESLAGALTELAHATAIAHGLGVTIEPVGRAAPAPTAESIRAALTDAAADLGLTTMELASGAGHDAQSLASITPSGMVFVPSIGGISHDPAEDTAWADCVNGANVLLNAALRLADSATPAGAG
jgi:N-carbamoyl-L-amino-acid hydrolase